MDPVECSHQGLLAYKDGTLEDAIVLFTRGIQLTPPSRPKFASKLLKDRADCYWDLQRKDEACSDMKRALELNPGIKDEPEKWSARGHEALEAENLSLACQCFSFSLLFCPSKNASLQSGLYAWRAEANYKMDKVAEARKDITRCRKIDPTLAKQQGRLKKELGVQLYQIHSYSKAIVSLGLAKEFIPRSMSEVLAQIHSYLASCHFSLRQYPQALEAGKEAYKIRPGRSQTEAKRWKERGKQLFKENRFNLLVECYSLAINYAPTSDRELLTQLLCNRSLVYIKNKTYRAALLDAEQCVKIRPGWSKAHYRLGSSLAGMKRYDDAMDSFAQALEFADTEDEKYDTLLQIISIGNEAEDGTATIYEGLCPQHIVQRAVDDAIAKENWESLRVLFLGGGGPYDACPGEGGLASGCDTSGVPLELVISSEVAEKKDLVSVLLEFGACVNGLAVCEKRPLLAALEMEEFEIATRLIQEGAQMGCVEHQPHLQTKAHSLYWKKLASKMTRCGNDSKAWHYYNLALQCSPVKAAELKRECYEALSDICFKRGDFLQCIEYGVKGYTVKADKNEELVQKWRERGNQLFKDKQYDLVIKYYSLAMDYVQVNDKLSAVLLSNRCAAYLNLKKYENALEDAERCVQIEPDWSKGYYRLGSCMNFLDRNKDALMYFCEGLKRAETDDDKFALASHVVNTAMDLKEGSLGISCRIPRGTVQKLIKDICSKKEWDKLHLLFLGGDSQRSFAKGRGGVATGCNAVIVPIDQVLGSSVPDRDKLIAVLLDHGALANGPHGCKTPPLSVAMEMEDYSIAHALLKHGADPAVIGCCRGTAAHHRENQGHYWKEEGIKALSSKDYSRAIKLLNLALHFPSNPAELIYIVNNSLATAYFETKQYIRAVEKGRDCLKSKPTKSQVEASKWKERGKRLFSEKEFAVLVEYYTLAMQYVPSTDKEFLATLLCNRALAHYNIGNYQQGLADAKSCTRFRPEWFKGYVRQGYCHACLDQNRDAVRVFGEGLKRAENDDDKSAVLSQIVSLGVNLADGTSSITCSVPNHILEKLIKQLVERSAWDKLHVLYLGGGGPQRYSPGEGGLATGIDAAEIPLELVFVANEKHRAPLVMALLENGASPNGLKKKPESPLEMALEAEDYNMVVTLLQYSADSSCLVTKAGDSLLHEAMKRLLTTGNYGFLQALLDSDLFDPDVVDGSGNSLFHLVAFGKCSKRKCDMVDVLLEAGANPTLKNADGKIPVDFLNKKDPRARLIRAATNSYKSGKKSGSAKRKKKILKKPDKPQQQVSTAHVQEEEEPEPEWCQLADDAARDDDDDDRVVKVKGRDKKPIPSAPSVKKDPLDKVRASIDDMIHNLRTEQFVEKVEEAGESAEGKPVAEVSSVVAKERKREEGGVGELVPDIERIQDDEEDDELNEGELQLDLESPFEDLPWEVDCTDQFWKALQNTNVSDVLKRRIVSRIRMLAEGRWTKKLCRRIDGLPKKHNIMLFEAKLTKTSRIIWELTVAFSAKCSDDPELRVQAETTSGRVYSEIIRVWDVTADRDALLKKVESIVKSHDRGLSCIVKKELSGFRRGDDKVKNTSGERLPNFFVEVAEKVTEVSYEKASKAVSAQAKGSSSQFFFPPASPNDMEYHILKFYAFSSALINTVLHNNQAVKVDFPFRVTELEHAIINLHPSQPCPIILLGRSGTGKTTCCLYRLWNEFQSYWDKAITAGPHIPKLVQFLPKSEASRGFTVCDEPEELFCEEESFKKDRHGVVEKSSSSEEFVRAKDARRKDYEEGDDTVELFEFEEHSKQEYEHLHQVFITKNPVLCTEVQKNFSELSHACPAAREHVESEDTPLPSRIQDIDDAAWPLFITSRDWLLLLDASLPGCEFFPRADDGSLTRKIYGWGEEETHLVAIDEDSDSEGEEREEAAAYEQMEDVGPGRQDLKNFDPRREVTYSVFVSELWPGMTKKLKAQYHPTLVWTEIRSFIKGSIEALHTECGYLSSEEYCELGRKRAPNFSADREVVYSLFRIYQQIKCSLRMFDEADVVHHIYNRLLQIQVPEWSVHRFYVDETQDFTQAELSLLIRCSRDPNGLFFTGDTAQSIMRGIAFRFNDLKSLFFYSQQSYQALGFQSGVRVPNKLYQLTHNYRSHAGILKLASSVVDLLLFYFPESFDRLEKDQGLFEGPKPVLLESCSFGDLAMILRGNRRQSSRIEFGAHQVILVASEETRAKMPDELKQGLILTIYESKGLEFDDVLIYNFFKDSQAKKEWRVVTTYIKAVAEGKVPNTTGLIELTEDELVTSTRPLQFDMDKHKVLNSEFKFLYTAITRARVNVWFFDEDEEARAPMFEYFQKLSLVRVIRMAGQPNETEQLTSMFVEKSTEAEWSQQGHYFYNKELWEVAVKCFNMAGDTLMIKKSQAQLQAAEAAKLKANPKVMRVQFLKAADQFLQCTMLDEGAKCLHNARERLLLAKLNRKLGKFEDAARQLRKERHFLEASECYEMINDYHQAVEALCQGNLYEEAIDTLQRYKSLVGVETGRGGVRPPKESRTVERLCHQLAEEHFSCGRLEEMVLVLERLPSANDRILFLENHGCVQEAVEALISEGRYTDAGNLLRKNGRFIEAAKFVHRKSFAAECYLAAARCLQRHASSAEKFELIEGPAETALELFDDCDDKNGEAECLLVLAKLNRDAEDAESARELFSKVNNICGEADACLALFAISNGDSSHSGLSDFPNVFIRGLDKVFGLILALNKPQNTVAELQSVEICERYFGLTKGDQADARCAFLNSGSLFVSDVPYRPADVRGNKLVVDVGVARGRISNYLCNVAHQLAQNINDTLAVKVRHHSVCGRFQRGKTCAVERCDLAHAPLSKEVFEKVFHFLCHQVHVNALVQSFVTSIARFDSQGQFSRALLANNIEDFRACQLLYDLLFPRMGLHVSWFSKEHVRVIRKHAVIREGLSRYADFLWKTSNDTQRRQNTDRFMEVSRILHLVGYHGKIAALLSVEEKAFVERNVTSPCDSMLLDKQTGEYSSFFRLLKDGTRVLHVYGDILNSAFFIIRRFTSLVACRSSIPLPSLANASAIFEHQLVACLTLFARLFNEYEHPVCLPESYLRLIDLWDAVYGSDKFPSLYSIVEASASKIPPFKGIYQVQRLLECMVQLVLGQVHRRFNLINSAFSTKALERVQSGETERVLLLAMTMLCNYGRGIPPRCGLLIDALRGVNVHAFLPYRVQKALVALQAADGVKDVVLALQCLLYERNERLFAVRWYNRRLWTDEVNISSFTQSFVMGASPWQFQEAVAGEPPADMYLPPEFQMPTGYLEEQRRERALESAREAAAVAIQRWYRQMRCQTRTSSPVQPSHSVESYFERFKADVSACSVCNVQFNHNTGETYRSHTQPGSSHWQMLQQFNIYKQLYLHKIWPLFAAERELCEELNALSGQRLGSHDFGLDVQRLEHVSARVGEGIRDIESCCKWGDTGRLMREVNTLEGTIMEVKGIVQQDLHKMREADDKAEKRDDLQETEDYGDEEDILDLRMPKEGGAKGGGRGKGKKRNRGRRAPRDKTRFRQS